MSGIQENDNSSLFSILRREVEKTLQSPLEMKFYTGSLKDALAADRRVRKGSDVDRDPPECMILSESMLLSPYKTLKICYLRKDAIQQIKIHELFHFKTPFITPPLPAMPNLDQLVEHHTLIALDEFWADYQSVLFMKKYGVLIVEGDIMIRRLNNGENIGRRLLKLFNTRRNYKSGALNKKILFNLIVELFTELKKIMYLLGLMRGSYEVGDIDNKERFNNIWFQLTNFIHEWSNGEQVETDFHPEFLILLQELHARLIEVNLPVIIMELSRQLNPVFKSYIYKGLIPCVYPRNIDIATQLLTDDPF